MQDKEIRFWNKKIIMKDKAMFRRFLNEIETEADYCTPEGYWKDFIPQSKPIIEAKEFICNNLTL